MLAPEQWERVRTLYHAVEDLPPDDQRAFLARACAGQPAIAQEVASLLAARDAAGRFLEHEDAEDEAVPMGEVSPGTRLGPFEVLSWIGAGGMGHVYRARDTRLGRDVAVKLLRPDFHLDPAHLSRFEREARALSSLTHPHICVLLDVGRCSVGAAPETPFLVMELLEGETLRSRLSRGLMPVDEALEYAVQIADALAAAHTRGIVHRDLKPANIMLTKSGVKLLDFGLAGIRSPVPAHAVRPGERDLTDAGQAAGTLPYMAPEQIRGERTDARTDLYAFGAVLYEMLSGTRAFAAESEAALVSRILEGDPPALPARGSVPPALARLVRTCLSKDPIDRWQHARDVALALRELRDQEGISAEPAARRTSPARIAAWTLAAASLAAAGLIVARRDTAAPSAPAPVQRLMLEAAPLSAGHAWSPAVSPDGRLIAFIGTQPGNTGFFVARLDTGEVYPLLARQDIDAGCWGASWSADSRTLLYYSGGSLREVDVRSGSESTLAVAPVPPSALHAGTARSGNTVLVGGPRLQRWASGDPVLRDVYDADGSVLLQVWPTFLPNGRDFVFAQAATDPAHQGIYLGSLASRDIVRLLPLYSNAAVSHSGHLLFARDGSVFAQPLDLERRAVTGEPSVVAAGVASAGGYTHFSPGTGDSLVYVAPADPLSRLVWHDRAGAQLGTVGEPSPYRQIALSPDGRRLAIELDKRARDDASNIRVLDLARQTPLAEQAGPGPPPEMADDTDPVWAPDSRRLAFTRISGNEIDLHIRSTDPPTTRIELARLPGMQWAEQWTRDGRFVLYVESDSATRTSLWALPLTGDRKPIALVTAPAVHDEPQLSPDGRWLSYVSFESGRAEVYLQRFDAPSERWLISTAGGGQPKWRADGRELFHLTLDGTMMVSRIAAEGVLGSPRALFAAGFSPDPALDQYAATPDGQRFLLIVPAADAQPARFTVLNNWRALIPAAPRAD